MCKKSYATEFRKSLKYDGLKNNDVPFKKEQVVYFIKIS